MTQLVARALRDNLKAVTEGDVSAPKIDPAALNLPYFKATRATAQNINATSPVKLTCNTEVYDPQNLYDNATNYRFTPNKPGLYLVGVYVTCSQIPSACTSMNARVFKNGSQIDSMATVKVDSTSPHGVLCTTLVQMNGASDYLESWVAFLPGSNTDIDIQGEFWAHCVGKL
ncbi:hypothetical protein QWJ07_04025 [Frankia sp. RB7]|nr:hypothetical protein [Frankia sp. RB7]